MSKTGRRYAEYADVPEITKLLRLVEATAALQDFQTRFNLTISRQARSGFNVSERGSATRSNRVDTNIPSRAKLAACCGSQSRAP